MSDLFSFIPKGASDQRMNALLGGQLMAAKREASHNLVVAENFDTGQLSSWLAKPYAGCIQLAGNHPVDGGSEIAKLVKNNTLVVSATSQMIYHVGLSFHLIKALSRRITIPDELSADIRTVLQEVISNGLLHGNLELESGPVSKTALQDLDHDIHTRIDDPSYGDRHLLVILNWSDDEIEIVVKDQGPGFDPDITDLDTYSGRGMMLIEGMSDHLSIEDQGRCIKVKFLRKAG